MKAEIIKKNLIKSQNEKQKSSPTKFSFLCFFIKQLQQTLHTSFWLDDTGDKKMNITSQAEFFCIDWFLIIILYFFFQNA